MKNKLSRRSFVKGVVGATALGATFDLERFASLLSVDDADSRCAIFSNSKSASIVGAEYLRQCPEESSLEGLEGLLPQLSSDASSELILKVIKERVEADFASAEVVYLNGWMISRTEARVCALNTLLRQAG